MNEIGQSYSQQDICEHYAPPPSKTVHKANESY